MNDNLFEWHVRLHQIDPESELANDLRELHVPHILLHLVFPENFPFAPPFMRVIEPRIEKGFVMEGTIVDEWHIFNELSHLIKRLYVSFLNNTYHAYIIKGIHSSTDIHGHPWTVAILPLTNSPHG